MQYPLLLSARGGKPRRCHGAGYACMHTSPRVCLVTAAAGGATIAQPPSHPPAQPHTHNLHRRHPTPTYPISSMTPPPPPHPISRLLQCTFLYVPSPHHPSSTAPNTLDRSQHPRQIPTTFNDRMAATMCSGANGCSMSQRSVTAD